MVESTIDKIKDITVERQIRKLAGVIDEQNKKIGESVDFSTDIENLKASDANQTTQINNLKQSVATDKLATESAITALQNKDAEQDGTLTNHATLIQGITESLVSNVQIMPGTTTGDIKVRLERESAASIDSNNYNLGLPVSAEIIQGTGPSMFKMQITMSTGVKVVSNDFVFTTEAIGNDVYISSFTFKAGNQNGYLSADIGLNNGVTIEANNFLVPTDPNVISNITDLQNRMVEVEKVKIDINSINSEISGIMSDLNTKVNISQGINNAGKALIVGKDGNVTTGEVSSGGGESWEEVNLSNFPTDWKSGDKVKIDFNIRAHNVSPYYTATSDNSTIVEFILTNEYYTSLRTIMSVVATSSTGIVYLVLINISKSALNLTDTDTNLMQFQIIRSDALDTFNITKANISTYVRKMWRIKA